MKLDFSYIPFILQFVTAFGCIGLFVSVVTFTGKFVEYLGTIESIGQHHLQTIIPFFGAVIISISVPSLGGLLFGIVLGSIVYFLGFILFDLIKELEIQ